MAISLVEGQTAPVDYQLLADGEAYNLGGCTVSLSAFLLGGTAKTFTGTVSTLDSATGKVRFLPDATDLLAAETGMRIRFKVVRADTKVEYFPSGMAEVWYINK